MALLAVILAASINGEAARQHAARLAALGPHPMGSPRGRAAALYVEAELSAAGVPNVRLHEFAAEGVSGVNVVGTLPGPSRESIVLAAHHDTVPNSAGAYDDGGGVGVLLEAARALAASGSRSRTIVFASFDGEEAVPPRRAGATGSRAWLRSLGAEARNVTAAVALEMCGWSGGAAVFQPIPYADPLRRGRYVVTPGWLMQAALDGSGRPGPRFGVGDPLLSWLYQPAVRTFRVGLHGDDAAFLQAGHPATFTTDSSFTRFYPHYHAAGDTADRLDAASLARIGNGVVSIVRTLSAARRVAAADQHWFAAFGHVFGAAFLYAVGGLSLFAGLRGLRDLSGIHRVCRVIQIAAVVYLLWRNPVPTLWVFALPLLTLGLARSRLLLALSLLPAAALGVLGLTAWKRGFVQGFWFDPWELGLLVLAVALFFVPAAGSRRRARKGGPGGRRRGLRRGRAEVM